MEFLKKKHPEPQILIYSDTNARLRSNEQKFKTDKEMKELLDNLGLNVIYLDEKCQYTWSNS